jgi:hypothetical protein
MDDDRSEASEPVGRAGQEPMKLADVAQRCADHGDRFDVIGQKKSVQVAFAPTVCNITLFGAAFREFGAKMFADSWTLKFGDLINGDSKVKTNGFGIE